METQIEGRRLIITKMDKEINKLGEIKKMLTDYKGKFPVAFESLTNELLTNIEVNLEYLERIFLLKPTKKNIDGLWKTYKDDWDLFITL